MQQANSLDQLKDILQPKDSLGSIHLHQRRPDKSSTLYLTQKVFQSSYLSQGEMLPQESFDHVHKPHLSGFHVSRTSAHEFDNRTTLPNIASNSIISPAASYPPETVIQKVELADQKIPIYQPQPLIIRKQPKGLDDPLAKQMKQTFVNATPNQNMYALYSMLRRGALPKAEETKKSQMFERIEINRQFQFKKFMSSTRTRGLTFVKFAFRSQEQQENHYIEQYMNEISKTTESGLGSMTVSDLWSNKQLLKFLKASHLNNDKIMLQKLNKMMIRDRKSNDQKELVKQKQIFNHIKDETRVEQAEHLGKLIFSPKKRYQQSIMANQPMHRSNHSNSSDKLKGLVYQIDEIHDDNLYLYKHMSNVIEKIQVKDRYK